MGSILASPGGPFWLFFELWGENLEILILTDSPSENLDFQGSGGLPGTISGAKNCSQNDMEAKSAQKPAPGVQKSLLERSWRASRAEKKNFGNFQKRPRGILEPLRGDYTL